MNLTAENYYSNEADRHYMSVSQYKGFLKCEAAALAKLNGWKEPTPEAFLVGSYVHSAFDGTIEQFRSEHPEIYTQKKELKAPFKQADEMIQTIAKDSLCMTMLTGEHETIITATLYGVEWKARIDVLAPDNGRIVDLKTVKSIREKYWHDGRYVSFVEAYGYTTQMAVYSELERIANRRFERLEPFIVAVSKEDVPDKAAICFDDETVNAALEDVREKLPRVIDVKTGFAEPIRCENCRYCRQTKKAEIVHYLNLLEVV
ncbi:PD-(D/E)XK nuclease-like domain-containing protein [Paenibacillus kobensis]|uniref:PD-(D/E)XK nuclease-like domain-containing protein n=1 Tax=Paenibacillus kobensis TaxID=59841 RepID=UPI000FD83CA2|nr:PD-(D/E)XK nuclease-like domain-containing protein [Paenibacillus kobensis]